MKLMYDEVSLGEVDDLSELTEYLESYSTDYFIGLESEKGWEEAVIMQVPHLFSLGRDPEKVRKIIVPPPRPESLLYGATGLIHIIVINVYLPTNILSLDCRMCTLLMC